MAFFNYNKNKSKKIVKDIDEQFNENEEFNND